MVSPSPKILLFIVLTLETTLSSGIVKENQPSLENLKATQERQFEKKHREELSKNPEGVTFTLRLMDKKNTFKQGEIISLELRFSSSTPGAFWLDSMWHDRSGRLNLDKFHLEPEEDLVDPLRDHFSFGVSSMGGVGSDEDLGEEPSLIHYDLNQWFRFDRPGKYRLYLASPRVGRIKEGRKLPSGDLNLTSNVIEFEILPADRMWQEQEFRRAVQWLESKSGDACGPCGCRALRFLGTKEAAREMIRRIGGEHDDCSFNYYAGLIGSPHREYVIEEMEKRLTSPAQPISSRYLHLLNKLIFHSRYPELTKMPPSRDQQVLDLFWQEWRERNSQVEKKSVERLAASLTWKSGRAKAISIYTLLGVDQKQLPASWRLPDVALIFDDLPPVAQYGLLAYRWTRIGRLAMLPALRRIYESPPGTYGLEFCDLALKRIYELAPEEGRRLIIAEIQNPKPRVRAGVLKILPEQSLPELDNFLADNLEREDSNQEIISSLIERYASPALLSRVRAFYEEREGKCPCFIQDSLLGYILRFDPATGAELVRRAMNFRGPDDSRCYASTLRAAGERRPCKEIEKVALEFLDDPDPEVVIDAVAMLGQSGSADVEETLWQRFETWHRQWAGRSSELENARDDDERLNNQRRLGETLLSTISGSPSWLVGPGKLERLRQLCV
ncbi:MAG: hypothetical protein L0226_15760 [Acidobacteria bacterium]|nr:hypothetical protein [Acidobacteriota bacterium]